MQPIKRTCSSIHVVFDSHLDVQVPLDIWLLSYNSYSVDCHMANCLHFSLNLEIKSMLFIIKALSFFRRFAVLQNSYAGTNKDGLNSLRYKVKSTKNHEYYIQISVDLQKDPDEKSR